MQKMNSCRLCGFKKSFEAVMFSVMTSPYVGSVEIYIARVSFCAHPVPVQLFYWLTKHLSCHY